MPQLRDQLYPLGPRQTARAAGHGISQTQGFAASPAEMVQKWLMRPGCWIKLHFIPAYCPHLDPIERLWGLMHKHVIPALVFSDSFLISHGADF
jgi:hypothetical protein